MNKNNNLALIALLLIGLISSLTLNLSAQNRVSAENNQTQKADSETNVLERYIEISSLPLDKKKAVFVKITPVERSNVFKFHLALQFVNRPTLSQEQKNIILEGISALSADAYDKSKDKTNIQIQTQSVEERAKILFSKNEFIEIFAKLGGDKEDVAILQKYRDLVSISSKAKRKQSFRESSAKDMSNLWKIQMAYYLAKDTELNKPQQEFMLRIIDFLKPSMYESSRKDNEEAEFDKILQEITNEARTLFTKEKYVEKIFNLGDAESDLENTNDCNCRKTGEADCLQDTTCASGGCNVVWIGCGAFYLQSCNGECRR